MKWIFGALIALALIPACRSSGSGKPNRIDVEPRALPGLKVRLSEEREGVTWLHAADKERRGRPDHVDVRSKLTLSFDVPPSLDLLEADPRWQALTQAVEQLQKLADRYVEISERAASLPPEETPDTLALQADARRFDTDLVTLLQSLIAHDGQPGLFANEAEFTAFGIESLSHPGGAYGALIAKIKAARHVLHESAKSAHDSKQDVLVTVRATLDPLVGQAQLLQVPGYYEKSEVELADDLSRARSREFDRLKAEYDASRKVAAAIRELQEKRGSLRNALQVGLNQARSRFEELRAWFDDLLDTRLATFRTAFEGNPVDTSALTPQEQEAWVELAKLGASFRQLTQLFATLPSGESVDPFADVQGWIANLKTLKDTLTGEGPGSWKSVLEQQGAKLSAAAAALADGPIKERVVKFAAQISADWGALRDGLKARLPATTEAVDVLEHLGVFDHAVSGLPVEDGTLIPHPGDDLPPVRLDLRRNPINHGDELNLSVQFWRQADYDASRRDPKSKAAPLETIDYTAEAIQTGWRWSGDVIFTRPFDGPSSGHFEANAAVSREYHWYSRDDPSSWLNRLDPGIGFHAAQLNMDPDSTTEFGVGINGSLWGGLLRAGVGYNISVDDNHEYWYIGFGLISALDRLNDLRTKTFGDGN